MLHEDKYKFAVGFVIYNPEVTFIKRLSLLNDIGVSVYILDNSPENEETQKSIVLFKNVTYVTAGKNLGLGLGISVVGATAFSSDFEMMLFLDQDTVITRETIDYINDFVMEQGSKYCTDYLLTLFQRQELNLAGNVKVRDVTLAISSGSLFYLENLRRIGWHNENYFVDLVDYEVCVRARRFSLRVGVVDAVPGFDHSLEQPDDEIVLFKKRLLIRRYSATRIQDALTAYAKLILYTVRHIDFTMTKTILSSLLMYIFGQIIARLRVVKSYIGG